MLFLLLCCSCFLQRARKEHDAVSCFNPEVTVHDCKLRVDGISKYLDSVGFRFDHAFGEDVSNQLVGAGLNVAPFRVRTNYLKIDACMWFRLMQ